ncbi:MAG TPA: GTPase [Candidatus Eisenbacteria bacterium]|nr:GTPase [Candidatus Eisenbacteria bacterium]
MLDAFGYMPANLPPDAAKKWAEVEATKNPRERIQKMEEFLSLVPKHKGTLRTRGQVKKQIAVLRREIEEKKRKKVGKGGPKLFIEKEGAAQIAILGMTGSGKSSLLAAVTNAKVEVSPNPFTTRQPVPGILEFEDLQFQLIETPAVMEGSSDGRAWGLQTLGTARNADGLIIVVDLSHDPVAQLSLVLGELERFRILVSKPLGRVEMERKYMGAGMRIILVGRLIDCTMKDIEQLLKSYRIADAVVKISGTVTLEDVEDAIFENTIYKPAVIVANKTDLQGTEKALQQLRTFVGGKMPVIAVSASGRVDRMLLGRKLFEALDVMRVYTKEPNERRHSEKPFILKKRSTIFGLARSIHSDFKEKFSFAKVWSKRLAFSPQKVGGAFELADGDVVEIHMA